MDSGTRQAKEVVMSVDGFTGNRHGYKSVLLRTLETDDGCAVTICWAYLPGEDEKPSDRFYIFRQEHWDIFPTGRFTAEYWHYQVIGSLFGSNLQHLPHPRLRGVDSSYKIINLMGFIAFCAHRMAHRPVRLPIRAIASSVVRMIAG